MRGVALCCFLALFLVGLINASPLSKSIEDAVLDIPTELDPSLRSERSSSYATIFAEPEEKPLVRSLSHLFDLNSRVESRGCFPYKNPEVKNHLDTCCWYNENTCCNQQVAGVVIPYIKGNLSKLQEEIGLGDECYFAVADLVCMICSPNTADFITTKLGTYQIHLCDSLCTKIFNACQKDLSKIPNMPSTVKDGEEFCEELFKDAKQKGNIIFDPKVDNTCYDGVPLEQVEGGYCLPGQKKPEENGKGLSNGAIVGIVIAVFVSVLALVLIVGGIGYYYYHKKRLNTQRQIEVALTSFDS